MFRQIFHQKRRRRLEPVTWKEQINRIRKCRDVGEQKAFSIQYYYPYSTIFNVTQFNMDNMKNKCSNCVALFQEEKVVSVTLDIVVKFVRISNY